MKQYCDNTVTQVSTTSDVVIVVVNITILLQTRGTLIQVIQVFGVTGASVGVGTKMTSLPRLCTLTTSIQTAFVVKTGRGSDSRRRGTGN